MRLALALWALLTGCAGDPGRFVWVDEYRDAVSPPREYVIVAGDVLNVRVFQQDNMSARVRVRNDGKVSLPFLNDVLAAGYTPAVLAQQLQTRLKDFVNTPVVTVSLEEIKPLPVSVLGEVAHPGIFQLEPGAGVLQALASAGGFTEFARQDGIYVLRKEAKEPNPTRIRFTYRALIRAHGKAAAFALQAGDVVVVE